MGCTTGTSVGPRDRAPLLIPEMVGPKPGGESLAAAWLNDAWFPDARWSIIVCGRSRTQRRRWSPMARFRMRFVEATGGGPGTP